MASTKIGAMRQLALVVPNSAPAIQGIRNALGRFQSLNQQARIAHEKMAQRCAEVVVAYLEEQIEKTGRDQRGTEELPRALLSQGNRYASQDGWTFGNPEFLDSTPARPYWRNLEVGTDVFVGRQFRGWFINVAGERVFPSERRVDPRLAQYGPVGTDVGEDTPKEQISYTFRGDRKTSTVGGQFQTSVSSIGPVRRRAPIITIRKPIEGYFYLERGGAEYLASGHVEETYDEMLRSAQVRATRS